MTYADVCKYICRESVCPMALAASQHWFHDIVWRIAGRSHQHEGTEEVLRLRGGSPARLLMAVLTCVLSRDRAFARSACSFILFVCTYHQGSHRRHPIGVLKTARVYAIFLCGNFG
jgi:hypothetical protein